MAEKRQRTGATTTRLAKKLKQKSKAPSFDRFTKLPGEIRHRIWQFAASQPRTVEVKGSRTRTEDSPAPTPTVRRYSKPPAMLQACAEARSIGTKIYDKAFPYNDEYTWINFNVDLVYMLGFGGAPLPGLGDMKPLIQRFQLDTENTEYFYHGAYKFFRDFTALRELHIVCLDSIRDWIQVAEHMDFPGDKLFFVDNKTQQSWTRKQILDKYPDNCPFPGYTNSPFRREYDPGLKSWDDVPEELHTQFMKRLQFGQVREPEVFL